jgi:hypothetical protein
VRGAQPTLVARAFFVPRYPLPEKWRPDKELFANVKRQVQERNVELETNVLVGHPAGQILTRAAKQGADFCAAPPMRAR